jgi:hypothetical protein
MLKENVWLKVCHSRDCNQLKHIEIIYTVHCLFLKEEESTRLMTTGHYPPFETVPTITSGCLFSIFPRVTSLQIVSQYHNTYIAFCLGGTAILHSSVVYVWTASVSAGQSINTKNFQRFFSTMQIGFLISLKLCDLYKFEMWWIIYDHLHIHVRTWLHTVTIGSADPTREIVSRPWGKVTQVN